MTLPACPPSGRRLRAPSRHGAPCARRKPGRRPRLATCIVLLALLASSGCITRTLAVNSQPPGARVILDGRFAGTTPFAQEFHSYGTRALDLELEGHARRRVLLDVDCPWWQVFPLDAVTDLLPVHDERAFDFALVPLDPEAATWEDARAAYARLQALREAWKLPLVPVPIRGRAGPQP